MKILPFQHIRPKLAAIRFKTGRIAWISRPISLYSSLLTFAQTKPTGAVQTEAGKPLPFVSLALLSNRYSSLVKRALQIRESTPGTVSAGGIGCGICIGKYRTHNGRYYVGNPA